MSAIASEIVPTSEAGPQIDRLVARALAGEEVLLGDAGTPVVKLVRYVPEPEEPKRRVGGQWRGKLFIRSDFDDPLDPEFEAAFAGLGT